MKLNIYNTPDEVIRGVADYFVAVANKVTATHDKFSVALSGGSSPKKLYELLASDEYNEKVDWQKIYFFFGDERNVPHTHPDSNCLMVKKALFDPLNIPETQIFEVETSLEPKEAAEHYTKLIEVFFAGREPKFDLVLLGLGDNSHTASLFPHTPVLHDDSVSVKEVFLHEQQVYRITFTAPLINLANNIAFLVYGEGKAEAVHHILEDEQNIDEYPAQLIKPVNGEVQWFLDEAAASKIKKP